MLENRSYVHPSPTRSLEEVGVERRAAMKAPVRTTVDVVVDAAPEDRAVALCDLTIAASGSCSDWHHGSRSLVAQPEGLAIRAAHNSAI